jgi:hypothetical protein
MKDKLHSDKSGKGNKFYSHAAVEYRGGSNIGSDSVLWHVGDLFILQGIKIIGSWKAHRHTSHRNLLWCSILVDSRSECHVYQDTFLVTYLYSASHDCYSEFLNQLLVTGCMVYMAGASRCACINLCQTCFALAYVRSSLLLSVVFFVYFQYCYCPVKIWPLALQYSHCKVKMCLLTL